MIDNKIFAEMKRNSYIGKNYERYKILIFVKGTPDINGYVSKVFKIFKEVADELKLNIAENEIAEYFALCNFYWYNLTENISTEGVDFEKAALDFAEKINAGMIINYGGSFRNFKENYTLNDNGKIENFLRPLFVNNIQNLKAAFKAYLSNLHSGFDKLIEDIADAISKGISPTDHLENLSGNGIPICNSFPVGTPTDKLFPELIVIVEDPTELKEGLEYIWKWINRTRGKFKARKVCLFTDKWDTAVVYRYKRAFLRYRKPFKPNQDDNILCRFRRRVHVPDSICNIEFDFRLFTDCGSVKIPF